MFRPVPAVVLGLLLVGCSAQGEAGSCHRAHDNACVEYTRPQGAAGKRMCASAGLTWTTGEKSCPAPNRVGTCTKKDEGVEVLYGGPPNNFTATTAKSACEFGGGVFAAP